MARHRVEGCAQPSRSPAGPRPWRGPGRARRRPASESRFAADSQQVEVTGHYINSIGSSDAASAGTITPQLIEDRPLLRPGNLLEYIPGMVVTQHSGSGKANPYCLRGLNLDHGTDFATWVAGMPVNLRTHAHGQGYTEEPSAGDPASSARWEQGGRVVRLRVAQHRGLELRQDRIKPVGLFATRERQRLSTTREDDVVEGSAGIFVSNDTQWSDTFR